MCVSLDGFFGELDAGVRAPAVCAKTAPDVTDLKYPCNPKRILQRIKTTTRIQRTSE